MKWQRFNAFHVIVLVRPVQRMIDSDKRGYLDGLLTRLLSGPSVHRVIVVEEERFQPAIKSWLGAQGRLEEIPEFRGKVGRTHVRQAIASLLYGTHLSTKQFSSAAASTIFSKLNPDWESEVMDIKRRPSLVDRMSRWVFTAGSYAKEMVESLQTPEARESLENPEQELPPLFRMAKDRGPSELSREWLEGLTQSLLDFQGWFTVAGLYDYVQAQTQKVGSNQRDLPQDLQRPLRPRSSERCTRLPPQSPDPTRHRRQADQGREAAEGDLVQGGRATLGNLPPAGAATTRR
jgi:hypothetical protein